MSGWQGRIINITREKKSEIIEIEWDSITLKQLPEEFIKDCLENGYDFGNMRLGIEDVELTTARDTQTEVEKQLVKTNEQYQHYGFGEEAKRIAAILSNDDLEVTEEKTKHLTLIPAKAYSKGSNAYRYGDLSMGREVLFWRRE